MTDEAKPPIRLKMKVGNLEFEIEGDANQVQITIDNILATITKKEYAKELTVTAERETPPARAETCKGLIQKLWEEGWFSSERALGIVHSELARRGYHYDRTAVAHALIDLVKDGLLTREGRPRRYHYAQKRPPPT